MLGGALAGAMTATRGGFPPGDARMEADADQELIRTDRAKSYPVPDGKLTFDKLSSVFLSGNATRDDAPNHIRVQREVPQELAELWTRMCPAAVYEVAENGVEVTPSNCVQCGAITAKGGRLTPPEGGAGPGLQAHLAMLELADVEAAREAIARAAAPHAHVLVGHAERADRRARSRSRPSSSSARAPSSRAAC